MWHEKKKCYCLLVTCKSPAVNDVRTISGPLEVGQTSYERDYRIRVIRYAKVRPPSVVELLHFTPVISTTHSESPYRVVSKLLDLDKSYGQITQTQATDIWPVLMTLSLKIRKRAR